MFICKYVSIVQDTIKFEQDLENLKEKVTDVIEKMNKEENAVRAYEKRIDALSFNDDTYLHMCMLMEQCAARLRKTEHTYNMYMNEINYIKSMLKKNVHYIKSNSKDWLAECGRYPPYMLPFNQKEIVQNILSFDWSLTNIE